MGKVYCTLKQLAAGVKVPIDERTTIVVGPDVAVATVIGRISDTGRTFPLPKALNALRQVFAVAVALRDPAAALVVAHVDTGDGDPDALTKERAEILSAWLQGDPQRWVDSYTEGVSEELRWGAREDRLMLRQMDLPNATGETRGRCLCAAGEIA